jgi:hypothetical protein
VADDAPPILGEDAAARPGDPVSGWPDEWFSEGNWPPGDPDPPDIKTWWWQWRKRADHKERKASKQGLTPSEFLNPTLRRRAMVIDALNRSGIGEAERRRHVALILGELCHDLAKSHASARAKREKYRGVAFIAAPALSVIFSTAGGAGGVALALKGNGTAAIVGGIAIGLGGAAAAVATTYGSEYARNRGKARTYEQLWWDVWNYAILELPTADLAGVNAKCAEFTLRRQAAGDP